MHDTRTINPYFHVDFCECDAHTILLASVGLAQAHPNYLLNILGSNKVSGFLPEHSLMLSTEAFVP